MIQNDTKWYEMMPLCSREASILGSAHGSWRLHLSSSSLLPHLVWHPDSPRHGWVRNLCPSLSFLDPPNIKCLHNHHQHHSFFNSEHLDCACYSCKCYIEHVWNMGTREWSSNEPDPGSLVSDQQKGKESPSRSPATKHWLSYRWKNLQSWARNHLDCPRTS